MSLKAMYSKEMGETAHPRDWVLGPLRLWAYSLSVILGCMGKAWPYLLVLVICIAVCPVILITLPLTIGLMALIER
jgi:hypothetical protein